MTLTYQFRVVDLEHGVGELAEDVVDVAARLGARFHEAMSEVSVRRLEADHHHV